MVDQVVDQVAVLEGVLVVVLVEVRVEVLVEVLAEVLVEVLAEEVDRNHMGADLDKVDLEGVDPEEGHIHPAMDWGQVVQTREMG
jgi:hypothetical protein